MTLKISYDLAHAAAWDAANAQMKREGRVKWSSEDYDLSVQTMETLRPNPHWIDDMPYHQVENADTFLGIKRLKKKENKDQ